MKISRGRPTLSAPVPSTPWVLRPVSPKVSGAFTQVPTCRAQDAYALAPRLPVLADQAEGIKVPTGQASGANMQVPTGQAPGALAQGKLSADASRLGSRYIRAVRMGSGSVYTYPPPVTRPNPWAQDIQAKLVIRSAGPVPSPG